MQVSNVKPEKHRLTIDSAYPCQLAKPDTSVFDIILNDRESSIKQVGEKFAPVEDNIDMHILPGNYVLLTRAEFALKTIRPKHSADRCCLILAKLFLLVVSLPLDR